MRLTLFGSGARGSDFDPSTSDADLLVDFDDGYGVDEYFGLKGDLETVLGLPVVDRRRFRRPIRSEEGIRLAG